MLNENDDRQEESSPGPHDQIPGPSGHTDSENSGKDAEEISRLLHQDAPVLSALADVVDSVKVNKKRRVSRLQTRLLLLAIFCLSVLLFFRFDPEVRDWIISQNSQVYNGQPGTVQELILPDGTLVKLGEDCQIKLARNFAALNTRRIHLSGQAYLGITEHNNTPLVIHLESGEIRTQGGTFNIRESHKDDGIALIVMKGEAVFEHFQQLPAVDLKSEQGAIFSSQKRNVITTGGNLENYLSWWTGRLEYQNTPVWIIARQLSNLFEKKIEFTSDELKQQRFSGKIESFDLEETLDIISTKVGFNYYFDPGEDSYLLEETD